MGAQEKPRVKIPQAGVPQIMTLEGMYVRAAYNNEGYAIIGYKTANMSIGEEWMLLEMGTTVREGVPNFSLKRSDLSLETPDGAKVPLPSVDDYRSANLARSTTCERRAGFNQPFPHGVAGMPNRLQRTQRPRLVGQVELSQNRVPGHLFRFWRHRTASTGSTSVPEKPVRVPFRI
jgi:hypothetical protein